MTTITPTIRLHTREEDAGLHIDSLVMKHNGNAYHLFGGTRDTIHIYSQSIALYVLTINKVDAIIHLHAYMSPEPFPINSFALRTAKEITRILGDKWEQLSPETIVQKLINYLI